MLNGRVCTLRYALKRLLTHDLLQITLQDRQAFEIALQSSQEKLDGKQLYLTTKRGCLMMKSDAR